MNHDRTARSLDRRGFLKLSGLGALALMGGGAAAGLTSKGGTAKAAVGPHATVQKLRLVATDGMIRLPGRPAFPDPDLYVFGFREVPLADPIPTLEANVKGKVTVTAPHIAVPEGDELQLTLTNVGFRERPDLDDSHTVHWHGFRNPIALFDGVPEMSIAVPPRREFTYVYRAKNPGTYIYHCHFEDSEHVQLGMTGVVFIRPAQDGTPLGGFTKFAYNDGNGFTGFNREFALLLNEIDTRPHDGLIRIQEFVWSDYAPQYWVINGRAYPDTLLPNLYDSHWTGTGAQAGLESQPNSSLIQVNAGDRVLLRMANLGYEQHSMELPGIPMAVAGEDATLLRAPGGANLSYGATTIYIAPGESRDVLLTAPAHSSGSGPPDVYFLRNRALHRLVNGDEPGQGGMQTEVRVYPTGTLGAQSYMNQTYSV